MCSRLVQVAVSPLVFLFLLAALPCAMAQETSGIFLTPIANAPFSGVIEIQRTVVTHSDDPVIQLKNLRDVARDSQGRICSVLHALQRASVTSPPPVFRIHIYDPQTRISTLLFPARKTYVTGVVNHPPAAEPADLIASPTGNSAPLSQFTKQQDLGTHELGGVQAHGVRETQTLPPANGAGSNIILTDEYWYSDELHMNVMVKHDDPRTGSVTMTLTQVTRAEPDPALFLIPAGYKPRGVMTEGPP